MLDYIVKDFDQFRLRNNDESLGAMVICDSSEQARELFKIFNDKYAESLTETESKRDQKRPSFSSRRR